MSREDALAELHRCAGTQFDPACVDALERSIDVIEGELASEALEANASDPLGLGLAPAGPKRCLTPAVRHDPRAHDRSGPGA